MSPDFGAQIIGLVYLSKFTIFTFSITPFLPLPLCPAMGLKGGDVLALRSASFRMRSLTDKRALSLPLCGAISHQLLRVGLPPRKHAYIIILASGRLRLPLPSRLLCRGQTGRGIAGCTKRPAQDEKTPHCLHPLPLDPSRDTGEGAGRGLWKM